MADLTLNTDGVRASADARVGVADQRHMNEIRPEMLANVGREPLDVRQPFFCHSLSIGGLILTVDVPDAEKIADGNRSAHVSLRVAQSLGNLDNRGRSGRALDHLTAARRRGARTTPRARARTARRRGARTTPRRGARTTPRGRSRTVTASRSRTRAATTFTGRLRLLAVRVMLNIVVDNTNSVQPTGITSRW